MYSELYVEIAKGGANGGEVAALPDQIRVASADLGIDG